jgi:copper resistance protein B
VSARLEAAYQVLITQRLIAEPEVELNAALQNVPRFDVRAGLNDYELGVRVRYEFRREFGPYVGWSRSRRVGGAAVHAGVRDEPVGESRFVAGVRIWR